MYRTFTRTTLASAIGLAMASNMAQAETAPQTETLSLEEVVVTAQKREENLQDTPVAVSALNQDQLVELGAANLDDLDGSIPALTTNPYPLSRSSLVTFIRGIGNVDVQSTQDGSVGVYMDGVYMGRAVGLAADMADLEQIEVLRGPQGTLFGRNTTGGAVNIITKKPGEEFEFSQALSYGNLGYVKSTTTVNSEVVNGFSARATYINSQKDGLVENTGEGNDFSELDKQAGKLGLRWENDLVTVDYSYDFSDIEGPQPFYQTLLPSDRVQETGAWIGQGAALNATNPNDWNKQVEDSETDVEGHALTVAVETGIGTFKSITSSRSLEEVSYIEFPVGFPFQVNLMTEQDQVSQEFQLVGEAGIVQYTTGVYFYEEDGEDREINNFLDRTIEAENSTVAVYGQATFSFTDQLDWTIGARYTEDERKASIVSTDFADKSAEEDFSNFNPSTSLSYAWNDELTTYAKIVSGYKSGGFNAKSTEAGFENPYDEEELLSYEIGAKSQILDNTLRINAAVFRNEYEDMQIQQITEPTKLYLTDVFNAGEATIQGFELDITALVASNVELGFSYAYLDAEFDKVDEGLTGNDITEHYEMPYAPENAYNLYVDWSIAEISGSELRLFMNYNYRDDQYGTADQRNSVANDEGYLLKDYGLLNGRISLSNIKVDDNSSIELAFWGKNLLNEEYLVHRFDFGGAQVGYYGEERTYGIDFKYHYK